MAKTPTNMAKSVKDRLLNIARQEGRVFDVLLVRFALERLLLSERLCLVRVCKETLYRFIYSKEDYGLGLYQYLPEARRKRRPLRSRKPRDGAFPATHRISQRPDFIGDRSRFGHWEGDLLIFERPLGHANVTSLVERRSRYTVLIKNPSRHSRPIMDKIIRAFSPLPAFARQSFTFDRGTEFAGFRALEEGIGARSWFCDPSAPWQKGTVENTNKRFRRFMPGATDLAAVSQHDLIQLARHLNDQPRKCLGYKTPAEVFMAHLQDEA